MNKRELSLAKDPDLYGSFAAIQRAAQEARRIAVQTNTAIIISQDEKIVRVNAEELQQNQKSS